MREFLLRGKRTDNGEWITDSETYIRDGDGIWLSDENLNVVKVIPETVGQYTGLTDKNEVKIFEGDIVRYGTNTNRADNEEIYEVVFETRGGSRYFGIRISEIETWQFCFEVPAKLMEVIGNIHDNPELLGGENNGNN